MFLFRSPVKIQYCGELPWPRGSVLGLRPPGLELQILCLEGSHSHRIHLTVVRRLSWPCLAYRWTNKSGLKPNSFIHSIIHSFIHSFFSCIHYLMLCFFFVKHFPLSVGSRHLVDLLPVPLRFFIGSKSSNTCYTVCMIIMLIETTPGWYCCPVYFRLFTFSLQSKYWIFI